MHQDPERSSRLIEQLATLFHADLYLGEWSGVEGFVKQLTIWQVRPELCAAPTAVEVLLEDLKRAASLSASSVTHILDVWQGESEIVVATEHVGGVSMAEAARRALGRGELLSLDVVLAAVLEVAQALDIAHDPQSSGGVVVHGDLRPQHVLLGFEGTVRLTGFGFGRFLPVVSPDGAWCTWDGRCYQPPERLDGGPLDPRADIFCLGAMLFEAMTGAPPYGTEDRGELVALLRRRAPVIPGTSIEMPDDVARVVRRACAVQLEERYQTASEMAADLHGVLFERRKAGTSRAKVREFVESLSTEPVDEETTTSRRRPQHQSDLLVRPASVKAPFGHPARVEAPRHKLVGRLDVLRSVSRALAGTSRGSGQIILIRAEPGMGRSRVLAEVAGRLSSSGRRLAWLQLRARRNEQNAPLAAAMRLLAAAVGMDPSAELAQLAEHGDRLRALGLDAQALEAVRGVLGTGAPFDPTRATGLVSQAVVRCVSGLAFEHTTIVAWDDLQWSDAASLECLGELLEQLDFMPVVAVLTARAGYEPPWPRARMMTIDLPPLTADECEEMVLERVPDATRVEPSLLEALMERSGSRPGFLKEAIDLAVEGGRLKLDGYTVQLAGGSGAALPDLEDAVRATLESLEPETLTVARIAALAEPALQERVVAAAAGIEEKAARRALDWLADQSGLLSRTASGLAFSSERHREITLGLAEPETLAALRGPTARAILAEGGDAEGLDDHAATLLAEGGALAAAAEVLHEAAKSREARGDRSGAAQRYARALELARDSGTLTVDFELKLCLAVGRMALHTLDLQLAERTLRDAVELADRTQQPKTGAEARILLLRLLAKQSNFEQAIEQAKEAIPLAEASNDKLTLARAYGALGETYQGWGQYGPDLRYVEAAIRFASDTGDLLQLGHFLQLAAMHAAGVGDGEKTKNLLERARPIARASNDPLLTGQLLKAEALLRIFQRDFQGALSASLEGAELAHRNGLLELEIIMLHNAGDAHLRLGNAREALYYFNESVRRSRAARYDRLTATNEIYIGYIEAAHLGAVEGLDRLKGAIDEARQKGRIWNLQEGNQLVGRILLSWGDRAGAIPYFEEAAKHARDSGIGFFIEEATYWLAQAQGVEIGLED